ncbi:hypothetical protein ES703_00926 [subsurface metagenome]
MQQALKRAATELNEKLAKMQGCITRMEVRVSSGLTGGIARIALVIDESDVRSKCILWVNEVGGSEAVALRRAQEKINARLAKLRGEIVGFYLKFITPPLPKRTYATLIVAVNEEVPKKVGKLSLGERRERLAVVLRLLGNDSKAINLVQVAKSFGVSRDTIYKDLQELGMER